MIKRYSRGLVSNRYYI